MDLDTESNIIKFIDAFYVEVLEDPLLKPIFLDGAKIDLSTHKLFIYQYWKKLLLGDKTYNRHTMNIHRAVHQNFPFSDQAFTRWLTLFMSTLNAQFSGPYSQKAALIATNIANNMKHALLEKN